MENETTYLRQVMQDCRHPAKVLAVTSGKGGVGKTNIAANLAICLAISQKKTLLVDADLSLGNLDIILGVNSKYNISHVVKGLKTFEEIIQAGPAGLELICGACGLEELANISEFQRQRLLLELSRLQKDTDVIVVDTAAGISRLVVGFCLAADHVLVVTTPQAPAMTDAYAIIKVLVRNGYGGGMSLIVNMAETATEGRKTYQRIATVAQQFLNASVYFAGVLVKDERLNYAVQMRKPLVLAYPKASVSLALAALAARLGNGLIANPSEQGFFRKVVNLFF